MGEEACELVVEAGSLDGGVTITWNMVMAIGNTERIRATRRGAIGHVGT